MADPTARRTLEHSSRSGRKALPIADGVTLFEGALVGIVAGYLDFWDDGASSVFLGVLLGGDDRLGDGAITGETSDTLPPTGRVNCEGVTLMHLDSVGDTPTQAKVGDLVYCADGNVDSMTLSATGRTHPIGYLSEFRSATDVDVTLFTPEEMLAQATA